jgi:hypothetical protein
MKVQHLHFPRFKIAAAWLLATIAAIAPVAAQSDDALLNKLVGKGILTTEEVADLKKESAQNFTKAYQAKTGLPDWVTALKLNGEFRGRYENFHGSDESFVDRDRLRLRIRLGATAILKDNFEVGMRLTTGVSEGEPNGNNATLQDDASKKAIALDTAYAKWTPVQNGTWSAAFTFGKMLNPFITSDLLWDGDITPEGFAEQFTYKINEQHKASLTLGQFVLDELQFSSHDPFLWGGQVRWDAAWSKKWSSTMGFTAMSISHVEMLTNGAVPNISAGNTRRPGSGELAAKFNPVNVDAGITYTLPSAPLYNGAFPIRVGGDYLYNPATSSDNHGWSAGFALGKAGKRGTWELLYRYRVMEADAWYEELTDSDSGGFYKAAPAGGKSNYAGGANVRGHIFAAGYSPTDSITLVATYYLTELIHENPVGSDSGMGRLQLSSIWKF